MNDLLLIVNPLATGAAVWAAVKLSSRSGTNIEQRSSRCSCGHVNVMRDPDTGRCLDLVRRLVSAKGRKRTYRWDPCPCVDHGDDEQRARFWTTEHRHL